MSAKDFDRFARPPHELTLRGRSYMVQPPSVDDSGVLLACAVRGEIVLGLVQGELPDEVQAVLDGIKPGEHPALGATYDRLVADGVDQVTIDRMAYYMVFFWARGQDYADMIAELLWSLEVDVSAGGATEAPKAL